MQSLFVLLVSVHDGDRQFPVLSLVISLHTSKLSTLTLVLFPHLPSPNLPLPSVFPCPHLDVELLVDDGHRLDLLVPGLGAGTEVTARHDHGLYQQPGGHQNLVKYSQLLLVRY